MAHQLAALSASQTRTVEKMSIVRSQQRAAATALATTLRNLDRSIGLQADGLAILERNLSAKKVLVSKGFFSAMALDDIERTLAAERQRSIELQSQRAQAIQASSTDDASRREAILADQVELDRLIQQKAETEAQDIRQRMIGRSIVRSEAEGQVADLNVKVGDSVGVGQFLGRVLSSDDRLEAELHVDGRAATVARPGTKLRLSLDAFPYQQYGWISGTVRYVDAVATARPDPSVENGVKRFRMVVSLSRKFMRSYGDELAILRGTSVRAKVLVRERTVLGWLCEPLSSIGDPQ
jgi:membrane fusion protein